MNSLQNTEAYKYTICKMIFELKLAQFIKKTSVSGNAYFNRKITTKKN